MTPLAAKSSPIRALAVSHASNAPGARRQNARPIPPPTIAPTATTVAFATDGAVGIASILPVSGSGVVMLMGCWTVRGTVDEPACRLLEEIDVVLHLGERWARGRWRGRIGLRCA